MLFPHPNKTNRRFFCPTQSARRVYFQNLNNLLTADVEERRSKTILLDMKKIFFVGVLSILCVSASFAQVRLGVTAGLNASKTVGSEDDESTDFKAGFQAGVVADFGITENFSIIPELLFSQRGAKYEGISATLNYLQLPINAAYKFDVGYGSKLFIFAGPYLGYGISTKVSSKSEGISISLDDFLKFGSKEEEIKPLDFGVNVGLGYQYDKIFFKLQYNHGLSNMSNVDDYSSKNMNVAVTVGYFFN